jgi:GDPmannose 4,6-dehydratase
VVATGEVHSVRDVISIVMESLGVSYAWQKDPSTGLEQAVDASGRIWVEQSEEFMRPNDVTYLCGDPTKIREKLGWKPTVGFEELIREMIERDI